jgi:hypothetical protein
MALSIVMLYDQSIQSHARMCALLTQRMRLQSVQVEILLTTRKNGGNEKCVQHSRPRTTRKTAAFETREWLGRWHKRNSVTV